MQQVKQVKVQYMKYENCCINNNSLADCNRSMKKKDINQICTDLSESVL